jgi:hypothetical protein
VALSFLMSYGDGEQHTSRPHIYRAYLLERLVVHKAGGILGYVELALLDVLAKLPVPSSARPFCMPWPSNRKQRADVHGGRERARLRKPAQVPSLGRGLVHETLRVATGHSHAGSCEDCRSPSCLPQAARPIAPVECHARRVQQSGIRIGNGQRKWLSQRSEFKNLQKLDSCHEGHRGREPAIDSWHVIARTSEAKPFTLRRLEGFFTSPTSVLLSRRMHNRAQRELNRRRHSSHLCRGSGGLLRPLMQA